LAAESFPIWTAFFGFVPPLLGGVASAMRIFVEPIKEFRSRASLIEKQLLEAIAVRLSALLNHSRRIDDDSLLRGDGRVEPDLVGDYTDSLFRLFRMAHRLELLRLTIRWCFNGLLGMALLGVAGVLIGLLSPVSRPYVVYAVACIVVLQGVLIVVNYQSARQLEQYEDIA
jgi:hypothetical protein